MRKSIQVILSLVFVVVLSSNLVGQTANDSSGCAPFKVDFTGFSGGVGTNYNWTFGDNTGSNLTNPTHTYGIPGTYTVSVSATVSGAPKTGTIIINVYGKPTPKFTALDPKKGCAPLAVTFNDQSTGGGGSAINKWEWTYGDGGGNPNGSANQNYQYQIAGVFDVSLKVYDANGCDSSIVITDLISVSVPPTVTIATTPSSSTACVPPLDVTFNGSAIANVPSGLSSALTYTWNFGNGSTASVIAPSPQQTYTANGTYAVTLTATDVNGCSKTTTKNVVIGKPFAAFQIKNDTVCKGELVSFTNISQGGTTYSWNFGAGQSSVTNTVLTPPVQHSYSNTGTYSVTLTVNKGYQCPDDTTIVLVVEEAIPNITSDTTYACEPQYHFNYYDASSSNVNSWFWTFSTTNPHYMVTPDSSSEKNPSVDYHLADTNQYTVHDPQYIDVVLTVSTPRGCTNTYTWLKYDTIYHPTSRFMPDTMMGCAPLTVQFSDSARSKEAITNWFYDFGDGGATSNLSDPTHTYNNPGIYYVYQTITNSRGCKDTSYAIKIEVGAPPNPDFSATPLSICPGQSVSFTDLTPLGDSVDTWHYYSDGAIYSSGCPDDPNPSWSYVADTGPQDVTLTVGWRGCYSSITKPALINVKGPLIMMRSFSDCDSSMVYTFKANPLDADSWTWDFGDGTVLNSVTTTTEVHTYASTGDYKAIITAVNGSSGCPASRDTLDVHVRKIKAEFIRTDSIFCSGDSIPYDASLSTDVYETCNSGYYWFFGPYPPRITESSTMYYAFPAPGKFDVTLVVKDINGCRDTVTYPIIASAVTSALTSDVKYTCVPQGVLLSDAQSTSDTTIVSYQWSFGDGNSTTVFAPIDSVVHTYTDTIPNTFTVITTVTNILGCTDTALVQLIQSRPKATINSPSDRTLCTGDSIKLSPAITSYPGYSWSFGDGDSSAQSSPWHEFNTPGTFTVSLTVTDSIGCKRTKSYYQSINVQSVPNPGFVTSKDTAQDMCYPKTMLFKDTTSGGPYVRTWDLGTGTGVVPNALVQNFYPTPGTYTAELELTTTNGCKKSVSVPFTLVGPTANFTVGPTTICKGDDITVQLIPSDTSQLKTWYWDFGDGTDVHGNQNPVTHSVNYHPVNGQGLIQLIFYSNDSMCEQVVSKSINIHQVIADFNRNSESSTVVTSADTSHCLNITDVFSNVSTANADSYFWNFGDGTTSSSYSPSHEFTTAGTYTVQLSIKDDLTGCVDTVNKIMEIVPLPDIVAIGGDTCLGSAVQINAQSTTAISYDWSPNAGLSDTSIANPIANPSVSTVYTVVVTNAGGCTNSGSAFVYIQQPPPSKTWDTTVVIGEPIPLDISGGTGFTYVWTPTTNLSCINCPKPVSTTTVDVVSYSVTVSDTMGCFSSISDFSVYIKPLSSVDVPSAFTPNGDGVNDIVYVDGWGIKKLLEYRIYNRWGELLFETNDINVGWDGTFKGVPQNTETYIYTVSVETYIGSEPLTLKGYIKLLR